MAAQLGVGFNPTVGLQNQQALERNEQLHQIELKRLEIELKRLQNELAKLEAGEAVEAPTLGAESEVTAPPSGGTSQVIAQLNALTSQVIDLIGQNFRTATTQQSPEHIYRDWQAYRAELRADEQAARLDETHDIRGNTLYRLQFTATVLPGAETDKFGIAMVDVKPPELNKAAVNSLYYDWLKHVSARLNRISREGIVPDRIYQRLAHATELFDRVYFEVSGKIKNGPVKRYGLRIAVEPQVRELVQQYVCLAYEGYGAVENQGTLGIGPLIKPSNAMRNICDEIQKDIKDRELKSTRA